MEPERRIECGQTAFRAQEATQSAALFGAFASQFVCAPSEKSVREAQVLIEQCGLADRLLGISAVWDVGKLRERFGNRFFVASSRTYVPLNESVLRAAQYVDGVWTYGSVQSRMVIHVAHCYQSAGFFPQAAVGETPFTNWLSPDHLAIELLFLAYLNQGIAQAYDTTVREKCLACARAFAHDHAQKAVFAAAALAAEKTYDEYAALLEACSRWLESWMFAAQNATANA